MTKYHLTLESSNAKTGPIPVSTSSSDTCPKSCGMYSACYAKSGPLGIHWRAIDQGGRGTALGTFLQSIKRLPNGQLWRHNQAGDLPGKDESIDRLALDRLVDANKGKRGFTYTHKPMTRENRQAVKHANRHGFTINLSADSPSQADRLAKLKVGPVVTVLPADVKENMRTPEGRLIVICPAVTHDSVTCAKCQLCAWKDREVVIGFPAHGAKKNSVLIQLGAK